MRKKTICTDLRCRKKHSAIGKVGIGALLTITLSGMTYPVYVFAEESQGNEVVTQDPVLEDENQATDFDDPVDEAKKAAGHKVYQASKMVDAQIQNLPHLTTSQMKDYSSQVNSAVMKALASINATKTPTDAMNAGDAGVAALEAILKTAQEANDKVIEDARNEAAEAIRSKAQAISKSIADSNLPQTDKDGLMDSLKDAESTAVNAIKSANTIADIDSAKTNGINALDKVAQDVQDAIDANKPVDEAKKEAIDKVEEAGNKAHDIINGLPYLTPEETKHFNDLVDSQVKEAIDAINMATTSKDARVAGEQGISEIEMIVQQARDLDMQNADDSNGDLPKTFDVSGLASGLAAAAGTILSALGIKSKK